MLEGAVPVVTLDPIWKILLVLEISKTCSVLLPLFATYRYLSDAKLIEVWFLLKIYLPELV
jgi:hypothetical protein